MPGRRIEYKPSNYREETNPLVGYLRRDIGRIERLSDFQIKDLADQIDKGKVAATLKHGQIMAGDGIDVDVRVDSTKQFFNEIGIRDRVFFVIKEDLNQGQEASLGITYNNRISSIVFRDAFQIGDEQKEVLDWYVEEGLNARDKLVRNFAPMAMRMAVDYDSSVDIGRRFKRVPLMDLIQHALIALDRSIDRFDPNAGVFLPYVKQNIIWEMKKVFEYENRQKRRSGKVSSLHEAAGDHTIFEYLDAASMPGQRQNPVEASLIRQETFDFIIRAIQTLPVRQACVLMLRTGFYKGNGSFYSIKDLPDDIKARIAYAIASNPDGLELKDIGQIFGVSKQAIHQNVQSAGRMLEKQFPELFGFLQKMWQDVEIDDVEEQGAYQATLSRLEKIKRSY